MKYAWIDTQRKAYPLPAMCETLTVSISGYRANPLPILDPLDGQLFELRRVFRLRYLVHIFPFQSVEFIPTSWKTKFRGKHIR